MKVILDIKNVTKIFDPEDGDVIISDGEKWYVTTKADLFREYEQKMDAKIAEINKLLKQMGEFKKDVSQQIVSMGEVVKKFVVLQEGDK